MYLNRKQKYLSYLPQIVLIGILLFACITRIHFLNVPLERDEGEYAYAGQLILKGIPPYKGFYGIKMPGIYLFYAFIMAMFGQTIQGIRIGLLIVNLITTFLLYLLCKRLFDTLTGVISSGIFAILSVSRSVQGPFANAEHFVLPFIIGGALLLLQGVGANRSKIFLSGIFFGTAFMVKQHAIAFALFGIIYILAEYYTHPTINRRALPSILAIYVGGAMLPFGLISLFLWIAGVFKKFWFWTFIYTQEYIKYIPFSYGLLRLHYSIMDKIHSSIFIWLFAGIGLIILLVNKKIRSKSLFVEMFFIFSFLSICPGFYFRPHYFILVIPAIAILSGIGISSVRKLIKPISIFIIIFIFFYSVYKQRVYLFRLSPESVSRETYGLNPFPESQEIAKYIKKNTDEDSRILVMGSEPQIYFYANRLSATGYIYMYPLMEPHKYVISMQKEMISEIEAAKPKYIVFVNIPTSWLVNKKSERLLFDWFKQYSKKYYKKIGIIDISVSGTSTYRWKDNNYRPTSPYYLLVYKREFD